MKVYPNTPLPGIRYEIRMVAPQGGVLPFNYRFKLMGYVYKLLNKVDSEFGMVLHERGFGREKFKFFTFSDLFIGRYKPTNKGLVIEPASSVRWYLSTLLPYIGERIVYEGILSSPEIDIAGVKFLLEGVVPIKPIFREKMYFRTISPVYIRIPVNRGDKLSYHHLLPHIDPELFEEKIAENIKRKMKVFAELEPSITVRVDRKYISRKVKALVRQGKDPLIYFRKTFSFKGRKIFASYVPMTLEGDISAISMAYYAGVGHGGPMGFGCLEVADGEKSS